MMVLHDLELILESKIVPTPPVVMLRVMEVQRNSDAELRDLVEAVSLDPGLTTKIIAMANSPVYRRDRDATTLTRAVGQVGQRSVVTLALAHSIASGVPKSGTVGGVDLAEFWRRSLITGVASRELAGLVAPALREEAFFVGLIAGLGRLALADCLAERYEAIVAKSDGWPTSQLEREGVGISSIKVTAELLRRWHLPELFSGALDAADGLELEDEQQLMLSELVGVAVTMSSFFSSQPDGFAYREMIKQIGALGVQPGEIDPILDALQENILEMSDQINLDATQINNSEILHAAREQLIELTLAADVELRSEKQRREQLEIDNLELEQRALRDGLTNLPNRRAFDEQYDQQLRLRLRSPETFGKPMGIVMIDLDHFKAVNDNYGHQIGDEVLRQVAQVLEMASRTEETVARYGGEEFVMLAPMATLEELTRAAERLRKAVALVEVELPNDEYLEVTASFGVAIMEAPSALEAGERLLGAADSALYKAKEAGRNCVVAVPEPVS